MAKPPDANGSITAPDLEILGDQLTLHPGHDSPSGGGTEQNLVEQMARFRESPFDFLREVSLHVYGTGWRAYENVIGQPVFYKGFTENMKSNVMAMPMLKTTIEDLAQQRVKVEDEMALFGVEEPGRQRKRAKREHELIRSLEDVVAKTLDEMICKMESKTFIRGAYYIATALLTRAYHQGIHVSSEEILRLRATAQVAARRKLPIIFLPCHRSHVDYVSLQVICYRLGISLPTVVAGDNLGFIGVKQFLQSAGAMWIRRSFAGDRLYSAVVQSYIETLMKGGFHIEAFVEGGRSRTGKLLPPKFGILSYILNAVMSGRIEDAIICPVSTQYDKVVETESYVSELLGNPKQKENIVDFLSSSSVLSLKLGRVDVRFHAPWSLKAFIAEQKERTAATPHVLNSSNADTSANSRIRLLRTLGYRVLSDINAVSVVMPTALIGTVLLTLRGRGVGKTELVRRVEWLTERIQAKGGRVAHFYGAPTEVVVERALEVLGPGLVGKVENLAEDIYFAVDRFQLSFYRNMTIHLFVQEALVCAGLYTKVKQGGGPANQKMKYSEIYDQVAFLSQLFQSEFIYPTEGLATNLLKTLEGLETDQVLKLLREHEGGISTITLTDQERSQGRENFDFYNFLIWPYVEASWLAAVSLMILTPPSSTQIPEPWVNLKKAQDMAQFFGKTLYHQGDLSYYEAVNKEVLSRSYERFVGKKILLVSKTQGEQPQAIVRLSPDWITRRDGNDKLVPEGRLWDFIESIAKSRREGKNRRDGATVSTRVLQLADRVSKTLFEQPNPSSKPDPEHLRQNNKTATETRSNL